jgi:hypothetical protein
MGNKKGRMPIPFDGDKEKKYIRLVAQPMPYGVLAFNLFPFKGRSSYEEVACSLFPLPCSLVNTNNRNNNIPLSGI